MTAQQPEPGAWSGAEHAAPPAHQGELERLLPVLVQLRAEFGAEIRAALAESVGEVRKASTPEGMAELAQLARDVATGAKDGAVVLAWLAAHGL